MVNFIVLFSLICNLLFGCARAENLSFDSESCGLLKDRIAGAFFGAAIGDALGRMTEFIPSTIGIKKKFGPEGVVKFEKTMEVYSPISLSYIVPYTDDTVMALVLARVIQEGRQSNLSVAIMMDRLARSYVRLLGQDKYKIDPLFAIRAHGITNSKSCQILQRCIDSGYAAKNPLWWHRKTDECDERFYAAVAQEGGCGSVMRAWPIGIIFADNISLIKELADKQSCLTHRHPMARAASVAHAVGVAQALLQKSPDEIAQAMIQAAQEFDDRELIYKKNASKRAEDYAFDSPMILQDTLLTSDMLRYAFAMAKEGKCPEEVLGVVNDKQANFRSASGFLLGWSADEAVAAALYVFIRHADDLKGALLEGVNTPGDSDSIASLAGALVGARTGIQLLNYCEFDYMLLENSRQIKSFAKNVHDDLAPCLAKRLLCV